MLRADILAFSFAILLTSACYAQETPSVGQPVNSDGVAGMTDRISALEERNDRVEGVADFLVLTFILLMFTNAVICSQWAISTNRSFWGWYLFGLFTGPLAGGFMLDRSARERSGDKTPVTGWAAVAGIGIPLAGWIIWIMLLK